MKFTNFKKQLQKYVIFGRMVSKGEIYMYSSYGRYGADAGIWLIISAVLAVVGGFVLYFTFLKKSNDGKFKGFAGWMYDFLTFKKMLIENLLRILYLICALFVTLASFASIGSSFLGFIITLVFGNLLIRIIYEFSLILLVICRNTTDINAKLGGKCCKSEDKKVEVVETRVETTPETNSESAE